MDDFDIDALAAYLHLAPAQVAQMANRGKLPGRRVGGQWRFSPADVHPWLEERIGLSDEQELLEMEDVLERQPLEPHYEPRPFAELLPLEAIAVPLPARTRGSVIREMCELAAGTGMLWEPEKMAEAVLAREELHPTALDNGVALLHPRRPMPNILSQPFLALGITAQGIPFGGGRRLTEIFFLIASTDDRAHLRILARLSRLIGSPEFLENLRHAESPALAHELILARESTLTD